ncbi:MAG TPA: tetratricopeptide repeat protein [Humisphaera sp.]|jgi:predicted O-linked N-acetylglucosamine transferase (SPINDLY family)|nr:tetratricopeptide repeat protein [Humisphaera sp.]
MSTIPQAFDLAIRAHQAGRIAEAENLYRQILAQNPNHADALHMLGVAAHQAGRNAEAIDLIGKALKLKPAAAPYHCNLGLALLGDNQTEQAAGAFGRAIALWPAFPEAHNNLGNALKRIGRIDHAIQFFAKAISLRPNFAEAHYNLGNAFTDARQIGAAIDSYQRAIAARPDYGEALNSLAAALRRRGQFDEAAEAYRRLLQLHPEAADVRMNLAATLRQRGRYDEAVAELRQLLASGHDSAGLRNNLGNALKDAGHFDEAIAELQTAVAMQPDAADAHYNLGNTLKDAGRLDEAIASYERAIEVQPDFNMAASARLYTLYFHPAFDAAAILAQHRKWNERYALPLVPSNAVTDNGHSPAPEADPSSPSPDTGLVDLVGKNGSSERKIRTYDPSECCKSSDPNFVPNKSTGPTPGKGWGGGRVEGASHANGPHPNPPPEYRRRGQDLSLNPSSTDRSPTRRLRLGYVSAEFRMHPVARLLLPLLAHHDHSAFEIFAYSDLGQPDIMTKRVRGHADVWKETASLSDEQFARQVRDDRIDILIDLGMHMSQNRLLAFARRPAPVQATYLAYCGTTGLETMDYRLTDPHLDPPTGDLPYTERSIHLPKTYWVYEAPPEAPPVNELPALASRQITFGCFNNYCKISDSALETWARLLARVPDSGLVLLAGFGSPRQRVLDAMDRHGVAADRIDFVWRVSLPQYLAHHHKIDIALDPFPYGGGTTTLDALWMGVPVVTLAGATAVGRGSVSILSNVGLSELIAGSAEQYIDIAVSLANDIDRLTKLRASMRERLLASPLMDAAGFARDMEDVLRKMWLSNATTHFGG